LFVANYPGLSLNVLKGEKAMDSGTLKVLTELSFDNLFVIIGLGFIAVAVFGNISGKINPDKKGRIASGIVGSGLLVFGLVWHVYAHGFRVTTVDLASPPRSQVVSCPVKLPLQGIIEAAGSGGVIYYFEFSDGNATAPERIDFDRSDSKLVVRVLELKQSVSNAWVKLKTIAPKKMSSQPSTPFTVTCLNNNDSGSSPAAHSNSPAHSSPPPPSTQRPSQPVPATAVPATATVDMSVDSVQIGSVSPAPGTHLTRGQPLTFTIDLTYNLASVDTAILSLSTAQFMSSMGGCNGSGGELVDAIEVPISRGSHQAKISLTWSGDTGQKSKGRVFGKGYVGFAPMFWAGNNGSRGDRLKYFGISPDYCYSFG
jgi:hypothetical protein